MALVLMIFMILLSACGPAQDTFFEGFRNPPVEAKPVAYWWWNGNHLEEGEIIREMDILHEAGFGGIRIFPIAMPLEAKDIDTKSVTWLSPEWNRFLKIACLGAKERGMKVDLLIGAGWPLGGEFLKLEQGIVKYEVFHEKIEGGKPVIKTREELLKNVTQRIKTDHFTRDLKFIKLLPAGIGSPGEAIDLMGSYEDGKLQFQPDQGEYNLVWGVLKKNFRNVGGGLKGSQGPAMDYFNKEAAAACFARLDGIEKDLGIPLSGLLSSLFCGSIEVSGANWTDDIAEVFEDRTGYSLEPYMPFVFDGTRDMEIEDKAFADTIKRVRYDYNATLIHLFMERFVGAFQEYCTKNDVQCHYQSYGHPWHYGMLEGYLVPEIPEGNNWIFSLFDMLPERDYFNWSKIHGDLIWNKYASSGGHLMGRKIISTESMTNTTHVFKTTLEDIKLADDMNFITGINHSFLHGFNYSPPAAGFPGWLKFGTYFSEQNTWWPYMKYWADYNARLSYVFQNSQPVSDIAILGPTADIWSKEGFERVPFHTQPWYLHELWESISQAGSSCDYVNEKIIQEAEFKDGAFCFGPMAYKALILADVLSIKPETARAVESFARQGGKVLFIGRLPSRSPSFKEWDKNDAQVKNTIRNILDLENVAVLDAPAQGEDLLAWTLQAFREYSIRPSVNILNPQAGVYQIFYRRKDKDILFFANTYYKQPVILRIGTETTLVPFAWDPETGARTKLPWDGKELALHLEPLESLLLVWDQDRDVQETETKQEAFQEDFVIASGWDATFSPVAGVDFERRLQTLTDLAETGDPQLETFAGTITYATSFSITGRDFTSLDLGGIAGGITEVQLNGQPLGCRWYGKHSYDISGHLKEGENRLEIKLVTTLANYARSLRENPAAMRWAEEYELSPAGLTGPVKLLSRR